MKESIVYADSVTSINRIGIFIKHSILDHKSIVHEDNTVKIMLNRICYEQITKSKENINEEQSVIRNNCILVINNVTSIHTSCEPHHFHTLLTMHMDEKNNIYFIFDNYNKIKIRVSSPMLLLLDISNSWDSKVKYNS